MNEKNTKSHETQINKPTTNIDYNTKNNNNTVFIFINGKKTEASYGTRLSDLFFTELPCGGHGKCGKCKVFAFGELSALTKEERDHLTSEEIKNGIRLACHTHVLGECTVSALSEKNSASVLTEGKKQTKELSPSFDRLAVAVDIGTTTLAASLLAPDGSTLSKYGMNNPQSVFGADVISRIEAALAGKGDELRDLITEAIDLAIRQLCNDAKVSPTEIDGAVITGNTVMLYLLTGSSPEPLSHSPFTLTRPFGEVLTADLLGLSALLPETKIFLPPCISAFIGADTVCAILSSGMLDEKNILPSMLADIGTNGEMALANNGTLYVCSTAAGPAFEGVGISRGMRGESGAIDKVTVVNGQLHASVIGGGEPKGICGSGLVDAVAALLDSEELDETGYLEDDEVTILSPVTLTAKDIRAVQLAKSAISAGIYTLINEACLTEEKIQTLFIAGGFGNYLNKKSAARIGLLPERLTEKTENLGNAALSGAEMLLLNEKLRSFAEDFSKKATVVELSTSKYFSDRFISGMLFE